MRQDLVRGLKNVARIRRWVSAIVARVFLQTNIEDLTHWSSAPVINALSDAYHPCQALADVEAIASATATTWRTPSCSRP